MKLPLSMNRMHREGNSKIWAGRIFSSSNLALPHSLAASMEGTDLVSSIKVSKKDEGPPRSRSRSPTCEPAIDPLKYAPIYGPIVTSPQQYIPVGYCLLECSECGGVDGMQSNIDICVYCADKIREKNAKAKEQQTESGCADSKAAGTSSSPK